MAAPTADLPLSSAPLPTPPAPPDLRMPDGPVTRFLIDPWSSVHTIGAGLWSWCQSTGPVALACLLGLTAAAVAGRRWWWRRCLAGLHPRARTVTILLPPTVDPAGAAAVWSHLIGLLRPAWRRVLTGQPHLAIEFVFTPEGPSIGVWVPGVIAPGLVQAAIEAAWPGAHTRTAPATPPLPTTTEPGQRRLVTGGVLRLARCEALPIRTEFTADPLRALLGAPVGLSATEQACVQILARPVTGHRVAATRRSGQQLHARRSPRLTGRILDLFTPATTPARTPGVPDPQTRLAYAAQDRAVVGKQLGPHWETTVRYAVTTTVSEQLPAAHTRRSVDQLRGRAHAIASALSVFSGHNHYRRHRLPHPLTALADRDLRRGDLLSVPELAALAHLPTDDAVPGLIRAGARAVAPPPTPPAPVRTSKPSGSATPATPVRSGCA
ncbi:MAG: hypothetical protein ACRDRL_25050 [Sciscionella sp.]